MRLGKWGIGLGLALLGSILLPGGPTAEPATETAETAMRHAGAQRDPAAALALYEAGMAAAREGRSEEAEVRFREAARFDAGFAQPHVALARLSFPRPSAYGHLWNAIRAALYRFSGQHLFLLNGLLVAVLVFGLTAGLLLLYVLAQGMARIHHVLSEILRSWFPGPVAAVAAAVVIIMPLLWNIGWLPVLALFVGLFQPWMRPAERRWSYTLVAITVLTPLVLWGLSPVLFSPLDPFSRAQLLESAMTEAPSPQLVRRLNTLAEEDPSDASIQFALGMVHKRAGRLDRARAAYNRAAELGGPADAIENNLGVIAYHRESYDDAVSHFKEAVFQSPKRAAPHYNLSQAYAKKLFFEKADEELREANRLSFRRVREMIKQKTGGTNGTLLDESLPAAAYWRAAWAGPRFAPDAPSWLHPLFPGAFLLLPLFTAPLFLAGRAAGARVYRYLAGFSCTNCDRPVCRRCLRRIHRKPYCLSCGEALLQIQSAAFSQLVLDARLKRSNRIIRFVEDGVSWILPGYHAVRLGRTDVGAGLTAGLVVSLLGLVMGRPPVERILWLDPGPGLWWPWLPIAVLVGVVATTIWTTSRLRAVVPMDELEAEEADAAEDAFFTQQENVA